MCRYDRDLREEEVICWLARNAHFLPLQTRYQITRGRSLLRDMKGDAGVIAQGRGRD
jgi:hypothetical protein